MDFLRGLCGLHPHCPRRQFRLGDAESRGGCHRTVLRDRPHRAEKSCFTSEQALTDYSSTLASLPLVAVYNWIDYNRSGGYSIWYGDRSCTATTTDVDYTLPTLVGETYDYNNPSGISENDTYSSVSTYTAQSCDIKLFDGTNNSGSSSPWIDSCTHLGGSGTGNCPSTNWYDRASSFQLS